MDAPNDPSSTERDASVQREDFRTADELWAAIARQPTDILTSTVYRGQANAEWRLIPRALRETGMAKYFASEHLTVGMQIYYEAQVLHFFLGQCDRIGLPVPNDSIARRRILNNLKESLHQFQTYPDQWPSDLWLDIMPLAQHHGVPTRLLDWSRRPQVAAYFAASDSLHLRDSSSRGSRLAIWALQTDQLEKLTLEPEAPLLSMQRLFADESEALPPEPYPGVRVVSAPGATSAHIAAQSGIFTLQKERGTSDQQPIRRSLNDELSQSPHLLRQWTLPVEEAGALLRLCFESEITAATIFRSYDGAGRAVIDWLEDVSENPLGSNSPVRLGNRRKSRV